MWTVRVASFSCSVLPQTEMCSSGASTTKPGSISAAPISFSTSWVHEGSTWKTDESCEAVLVDGKIRVKTPKRSIAFTVKGICGT